MHHTEREFITASPPSSSVNSFLIESGLKIANDPAKALSFFPKYS